MIRELLFMLSGQPGALFVLKDNGQFEMCSGIADVGLCQSEKEIIKPLLKIGSNVAFLNEFAENRKVRSLYLEVIKQSIAQCVTEFQEELLVIEVEILEGSSILGVTGIHSKMVIPITPSIRGGNSHLVYYPLPPEGHHIKHRQ